MKLAFTTERLNVFHATVRPNFQCVERDVFVAFLRDKDYPGHVVTATVFTGTKDVMGGAYLDWIETSANQRRHGFARELCLGIMLFLDTPLVYDGATAEGERFCTAMDRHLESLAGKKEAKT